MIVGSWNIQTEIHSAEPSTAFHYKSFGKKKLSNFLLSNMQIYFFLNDKFGITILLSPKKNTGMLV